MAKPTVADVQARCETDLGNDALQQLIDAAQEEVTTRYGEDSLQVDTLEGMGGWVLYLSRQADSITSVVETIARQDTTLATDDYELRERGWGLTRLDTGTNQRSSWGTEVKVTYVPELERRRFGVVVDLVILATQFDGLEESRTGDSMTAQFSSGGRSYMQKKEDILRTLATGQRLIA